MINILIQLAEKNRVLSAMGSFLLAIGIGIIDFLTGYELGISLFYLLPVSAATWFAGRSTGIAIAVISAFIWFTADLMSGHLYSHPAIVYWNTGIRFGIFLVVTLLLAALKKAHEHEKELARTDNLTGAVNARFFYELVKMEIVRSQRNHRPFTLAYIDLDNFKTINDSLGHNVGDKVLRAIVQHAVSRLRKTDVVSRLGGDEFAFLLPETDQAAAQVFISKIQLSLLEELRRNNWPITLSIGVLTCVDTPVSPDELIKQADGLMYSVKNNGKNSICYSVHQA
ncbi:MAG: GGDEF domain-containing protein [Gammaproteobacteria bacterium]|nr:GGDEF domain-containing protein [Gammaproteobacteria bacterium]